MKKIIFIIVTMLLTTKIYAYDNNDFQVWNTDVEEFKMNKNLKLSLEEEFRWQDNAEELCYKHYDAGLFYDLRKWLNIGGGYRQVYELINGKFKPENEPYATVALSWDIAGFKFEGRNRLEYRNFNYKEDSWRYRNKITMRLPWKFFKICLQPYLADEVFVAFGGVPCELNQNRFSSGVSINLTKNSKTEIYYMLQDTKKSGKWPRTNILGLKLKLEF